MSSRNNGPVPAYYDIDSDSDTPILVFDIDSGSDSDTDDDVVPDSHPLDLPDESIGRLTLEENTGSRTPPTPPPPYEQSASASRRRSYIFTSPRRTGRTNDWSEAAEATQGSPLALVRAVHQPRSRPASRNPTAYVVFRGRNIGVRLTWREVQADTSGVRFSLQQGYRNEADAQAAFDHAHANGWTCTSSEWAPTPITRSQAPLPVTEENPSPSHLSSRRPDDPWYVVYAGVNPGIFPTSLECALNVLGISCSWYERAESYSAAVVAFHRALDRGEVHVRLERRGRGG
ncbi:hypothetical protein C8R47DRAFT_1228147 [Mycena vitilis]|nr:hypothetical protein C8R47DRAFT_1228147 [Mycena vitilis]